MLAAVVHSQQLLILAVKGLACVEPGLCCRLGWVLAGQPCCVALCCAVGLQGQYGSSQLGRTWSCADLGCMLGYHQLLLWRDGCVCLSRCSVLCCMTDSFSLPHQSLYSATCTVACTGIHLYVCAMSRPQWWWPDTLCLELGLCPVWPEFLHQSTTALVLSCVLYTGCRPWGQYPC